MKTGLSCIFPMVVLIGLSHFALILVPGIESFLLLRSSQLWTRSSSKVSTDRFAGKMQPVMARVCTLLAMPPILLIQLMQCQIIRDIST